MQLSQCNDLRPGNLNLDKIVSVWFFFWDHNSHYIVIWFYQATAKMDA